jgi:hypothetical protein
MTIWRVEVSSPPGVVNVCDEETDISVKSIVYTVMC